MLSQKLNKFHVQRQNLRHSTFDTFISLNGFKFINSVDDFYITKKIISALEKNTVKQLSFSLLMMALNFHKHCIVHINTKLYKTVERFSKF